MVKSRKPKSPTPCLSTVLWSPASFINLDIFSYYLLLVFGIFIALCKMTKLFVVPSPPRCNFLMITDKHKCPSMKLITLCGCQLSIFLMDISKKFAFYHRFRDTFYWFRTLFFRVHFFFQCVFVFWVVYMSQERSKNTAIILSLRCKKSEHSFDRLWEVCLHWDVM